MPPGPCRFLSCFELNRIQLEITRRSKTSSKTTARRRANVLPWWNPELLVQYSGINCRIELDKLRKGHEAILKDTNQSFVLSFWSFWSLNAFVSFPNLIQMNHNFTYMFRLYYIYNISLIMYIYICMYNHVHILLWFLIVITIDPKSIYIIFIS